MKLNYYCSFESKKAKLINLFGASVREDRRTLFCQKCIICKKCKLRGKGLEVWDFLNNFAGKYCRKI